MSRLAYYPTPATRRLGSFTLDACPPTSPRGTAKRWSGSLGLWGVGAGTALVFLLSVTPKVKNTLLLKIPVLSDYYEDKTPASDKPF
ncbi:ubiquinol-cytochrome-c reductase complex subunit-domain-containing protein [Russula ochroleuca]|uniref:Ubiquinol-cytochrome-c reductase complex subunit-domain-containing protein n=1 Tax=Russula ochroleuca TaxID=152965 RepID=A0A9P5T8T0_9AGAM|nr:ubiquinol-cytochrome-c reductase complex subunit-domain-containing protein [Russula ochroleuca]